MVKLTKSDKKVEEYTGQLVFDIKIIVEETDERYTAYLRIGDDGTTNFLYSALKSNTPKDRFIATVQGMIHTKKLIDYYWWLNDDEDEYENDEE